MKTKYIQIGESERRRIERLKETGESIRSIARKLARSPSAIKYEIDRNTVNEQYLACKANHKAYARRKYSKIQCMKVVMDKNLRSFVEEKIRAEWSPESISGRIKEIEKKLLYASTKAIYKFVYSVYGRNLERYLYSKAVRKKGGPKRKRASWKDNRRFIDERPKRVEKRREFGHFEADFIESGRDGRGSLLVIVERKTRYPFLVYTEDRTTECVNRLILETLNGVLVRSVTVDNDISLQKHRELSRMLQTDIFFCHPFTSQEKGTVENRNKAIRRDVPKRSDLSKYASVFPNIERKLRTKPMKCLDFRTPEEMWQKEMQKYRNKKSAQMARGIMVETLQTNKSVLLQGCV